MDFLLVFAHFICFFDLPPHTHLYAQLVGVCVCVCGYNFSIIVEFWLIFTPRILWHLRLFTSPAAKMQFMCVGQVLSIRIFVVFLLFVCFLFFLLGFRFHFMPLQCYCHLSFAWFTLIAGAKCVICAACQLIEIMADTRWHRPYLTADSQMAFGGFCTPIRIRKINNKAECKSMCKIQCAKYMSDEIKFKYFGLLRVVLKLEKQLKC